MSNMHTTLGDFFSFSEGALSSSQLKRIDSSENMLQLREKIAEQARTLNWSGIFREAMKNVNKLLDIKLADIMISAWTQGQILHKYADSQKHSPDEIVMVPLVEHAIKSTHRPYVEVLINEKPVGKINFKIELTLMLKGMTLKMKAGKVTEILTGSCMGKGTIECESMLILEKKTGLVPLPGSITLGDGMDIA